MKVYPNLEREIVHESDTLANAFQAQGSNQTCFGTEATVRLIASMDCYTSFSTFSDIMTPTLIFSFLSQSKAPTDLYNSH